MGISRKRRVIVGGLLCSLLIGQVTYAKAAEVTNTNVITVSNSLRLQDDFYNVINRQWLNTAKIDTGKTSNSTFMETDKTLTEQKKQIIKDLLSNEKTYSENSDETKIINLYKNTLNMEARNKNGIEPIKKMIEQVNNIKSTKDISNLNTESKIGNPLLQIACEVDLKDANKYALYIAPPSLSLGNSDEYIKPTENTKRVKSLVETYYTNLLTLSGYTNDQAKAKVTNLFKFENMIAPSIKGKEETSKNDNAINEQYNVIP